MKSTAVFLATFADVPGRPKPDSARQPGRRGRAAQKLRMANLAVVGSHSTNGVAEIHSKLLRETTLKDLAEIFPERFNNKTNGVTPRRWMQLCQSWTFRTHRRRHRRWLDPRSSELSKLKHSPRTVASATTSAKPSRMPSDNSADWLRLSTGQILDPESIFDCQVKRIHEYKRQFLNALRIVVLYNRLRKTRASTCTHVRSFSQARPRLRIGWPK